MKFKLYEYNVTPNVNENDEFFIRLLDNTITINGNTIEDENKVSAIVNLLEGYKLDIIRLSAESVGNYKGGRQKELTINFEASDEIYSVIGNTPSEEMAALYSEIKEELIKIIEQ